MGLSSGPILSLKDLDVASKLVFLRLDLNVPLSEPIGDEPRKIEDDNRIQQALPTIKFLMEKGARVVMASHLGRPDGKKDGAFSLEPIAAHLASLLDKEVTLADDCVGEGIELMARKLKASEILLLENLRFHEGEEKNDQAFSHQLSRLADIYVTDAFGTTHRKHASTYGLPAIMPTKGVGLLIERELLFLNQLLEKPAEPFYLILGGSKVSDKIRAIYSLMKHVDGLLVGGAMAYAFIAAQGSSLPEGARKPSDQDVLNAKRILNIAKKWDIAVMLPEDFNQGLDIGPRSIERFTTFLHDAKTIFWNGPLGKFEDPQFAAGSRAVAETLAQLQAVKVLGGGDTVAAIQSFGLAAGFDHLSTGGGAVLEYLEGNGLPGIDILKSDPRRPPGLVH